MIMIAIVVDEECGHFSLNAAAMKPPLGSLVTEREKAVLMSLADAFNAKIKETYPEREFDHQTVDNIAPVKESGDSFSA